VAHELFFHLKESNWEASRFPHFLRQHSVETREIYQEKLTTRPNLSPFDHFLEHTLGWTDAQCPLDYHKGCTNLPSPEHVRAQYPHDRHRARQIIFIIEAQRLALEQGRAIKWVLESARDKLKK